VEGIELPAALALTTNPFTSILAFDRVWWIPDDCEDLLVFDLLSFFHLGTDGRQQEVWFWLNWL